MENGKNISPCAFCESGLDMLPALPDRGGDYYHQFDVKTQGYPLCGYAFEHAYDKHPFIPNINHNFCSFCSSLKKDVIHNVGH